MNPVHSDSQEQSQAESFQRFVGGTLVEYQARHGFRREWGRVKIVSVTPAPGGGDDSVFLQTDGRAEFGIASVYDARFRGHEEVLYFYAPVLRLHFAIAPPGVALPRPEERDGFDPEKLFLC